MLNSQSSIVDMNFARVLVNVNYVDSICGFCFFFPSGLLSERLAETLGVELTSSLYCRLANYT